MAMHLAQETNESSPPERFVVEVFSELSERTVKQRWAAVNVILRLSMLSGLQMQLDAVLNLLCDFAADMVAYDRALVYFWDDEQQPARLRVVRGAEAPELTMGGPALGRAAMVGMSGNLLNLWSTKFGKPLLVVAGVNAQADACLASVESACALVIPLFVNNRVIGSLQLFADKPGAFSAEDAQLLWMLALVAESLLTREYANDGLIHFAFTDYLTGLKTRGYFEQQLELEIKRSERKKTHFALVMIDIDFFKGLNDKYGHHAGDQVLRDVSSILLKEMREVDTAARYGGEEFVLILPETNGPGAKLVAERLRRGVESAKFFAGSPDAIERLTISLGVAIWGQDAAFRRDLIEFADEALYAAKDEGRNRVVLYSDLLRKKQRDAG
jgi:diguanylate cyclase (GGDEF)-like protein